MCWFILAQTAQPVVRAQIPQSGSFRRAMITEEYTTYRFWLARYSDNQILCDFAIEHAGVPTVNDVKRLCGEEIAGFWAESKPCTRAQSEAGTCPGLYLVQLEQRQKTRDVEVELPMPQAWIEVAECSSLPDERKCQTMPVILIHAREPLEHEIIINVEGSVAGVPFSCPGDTCRLPIPPTSEEGVDMVFWANSSYGDSTPHYPARVRLVPWGDFTNPEGQSVDPQTWYIDVLSDQWAGGGLPTCSESWQAFPNLEGIPQWLSSPDSVDGLRTDVDYHYLAGQLIHSGVVDASTCLDGGLSTLNIASTCGVEAAKPYLGQWQNRFDPVIQEAARITGIPSMLMKADFARESQLWPGIFKDYREAGLGQLTDRGADTILMWNPDLYRTFCSTVMAQDSCDKGYVNLTPALRDMLRGALVSRVNADCPGCSSGLNMDQATNSIRVFSEGLLANCDQVGQILRNISGLQPGITTPYDDLWRFTLVNYNAGPGCLGTALNRARNNGEPLDWAHVSARLDPACQAAIGYVEDISREKQVLPSPTPWLGSAGAFSTPVNPVVGATPTYLPTALVRTSTPTPTPTLTPTITGTAPTPTPSITPPP